MQKLYILDAFGYIYRSYFAIRQMTNLQGESTNALYGFIRSVLKLFNDFNPTHVVAVFDGPNNIQARTEIYKEYKEHRKEMPKDLGYQILWAQQFCQMMGIPEIMLSGVEADDTMGSIAKWAAAQQTEVYLCSSDKDLCQLVNSHIFVLNSYKENQILNETGVKKQFGVFPHQMVDFLAITGDVSDNIPGLTGFGPKTAAQLLEQFGTLDCILENPSAVSGNKKQQTLKDEKEKVLLSRRLVTIHTDVPFVKEENFFQLGTPHLTLLREFYSRMNFSSLIREIETKKELYRSAGQTNPLEEVISYQMVNDKESIEQLVAELSTHREICVDVETTHIQPLYAELVGIGLGVEEKKAWYIPFNSILEQKEIIQILQPFFANPAIGFYGHNLKYDYHVLNKYGMTIATICFDTILASYVLNTHSRKHSLDDLSLEYFNKVKISIHDLIGKGKKQISLLEVPVDRVCYYCCEDIDYTIRLKNKLTPMIEHRKLGALLYKLDLPLLPVLANMEKRGIYVDIPYLDDLSHYLNKEIAQLSESIFEMAGEKFNLNSPKQLAEVLFQKLQIIPPKKIATGFSTNAEVLETLKIDYPIAAHLLDYRSLEKLRSTYVEALPHQVHPETGRIHCQFNQTLTATGRLSCQEPNLQNIPVRTEVGKKIRAAFRPQYEGWSYLSADYSQIELRILAHLSEDPILITAFESNEDIHTFTASQVFHVALEEVTSTQRYQAKTVNFGIMYGQQSFGLSKELGVSVKEATLFIQAYFKRYAKVKEFLDHCKILAKESGKALTLAGRERLIPEIGSANAMIRAGAERFAINTPIQGTQADLIKMAMIEIQKQLVAKNLKAFMILQIHDELLFEVPNEELEEVSTLVHDVMSTIVKLKVPLVVDLNIGKNWEEC